MWDGYIKEVADNLETKMVVCSYNDVSNIMCVFLYVYVYILLIVLSKMLNCLRTGVLTISMSSFPPIFAFLLIVHIK